MLNVGAVLQAQDRHNLLLAVHNPVLQDTRFSVVAAFQVVVTLGVVLAHHFQYQVRPQPVAVLGTRVVGIQEEKQVRLAEFARPHAKAQGGEVDHTTARFQEGDEGQEQTLEDGLVVVSRRGENLEIAVGEFDEVVGVVGHPEVAFIAPLPLPRQQV